MKDLTPLTGLQRVYELKALIKDTSSQDAYFQNFESSMEINPLKRKAFFNLEKNLQYLDSYAWDELKKNIYPLLLKRDELRGWQPLFDRLNEVYGYAYLVDLGCQNISFIHRSKKNGVQTPDLSAIFNGTKVFCEVKTINTSQEQLIARKEIKAREETGELSEGFINKFLKDSIKAYEQLTSFSCCSPNSKLIAYFIIHFDNFTGEFDPHYYNTIREVLNKIDIKRVEFIFHSEINN